MNITFDPVPESRLPDFVKRVQTAFMAFLPEDQRAASEPIPGDDDVISNYHMDGAETCDIYADGELVGGMIVTIDRKTNHNHLDFFFIDPSVHSRGLGYAAWCAIEKRYPETEVWQLGTPYFEKRNIHFYVNKYGFRITEFFWKGHPDPNMPEDYADYGEEDPTGTEDGFFMFEKVMKK